MTPALVFDCDGVLADTELHGHLPAFNDTFAEVGIPVRWSEEEYISLLAIGGGKERMRAALAPYFDAQGLTEAERASLVAKWHKLKTARYLEIIAAGQIPPRPGVRRLAAEALERGWAVAVASTSAESSVRAVLEHCVGTDLARRIPVLAGEMVGHKKPAPDIYLLALETLGADPRHTVVVEDSNTGLRASRAAGLTTVVTSNPCTAHDNFSGAALVATSLGDLPGEPATALVNPHGFTLRGVIDTALLADLLAAVARSAVGPAGT